MVLFSQPFCCCILTLIMLIFIIGLPSGCCCIIPITCFWSVFSIIFIIFGAIIIIFILVVSVTLTITTIESIILALYLEAIACFCCGQIPYIPFDFGLKEWKLMIILSLFSSRINFLTDSYSDFCRDYAEKYLK